MFEGLPLTIFHATVVLFGGVVLLGTKFLIDVARSPRPKPIKIRRKQNERKRKM